MGHTRANGTASVIKCNCYKMLFKSPHLLSSVYKAYFVHTLKAASLINCLALSPHIAGTVNTQRTCVASALLKCEVNNYSNHS